MMTDVYGKHLKAFEGIFACVIVHNGERVANISFKCRGAVTAYVHWIGEEMRFGIAGGGGYDRKSRAVSCAARKMAATLAETKYANGCISRPPSDEESAAYAAFRAACLADTGAGWERALIDAGFQIFHAL